MDAEIIEADYSNANHAEDLVHLVNEYAWDEMGMGAPLGEEVQNHLVDRLSQMPTAFSLLAYNSKKPVGVANCFIGFSTFEARKLVNIHDLAVTPSFRGRGIGEQLLMAVQRKAKKLNCCRLTLEVRKDNPARRLYERFGFEEDDPQMWFLTKELYGGGWRG